LLLEQNLTRGVCRESQQETSMTGDLSGMMLWMWLFIAPSAAIVIASMQAWAPRSGMRPVSEHQPIRRNPAAM
jgi:hypothetical protein